MFVRLLLGEKQNFANARLSVGLRRMASRTPTTLKGMVFMDGTWAYYNMVEGKGLDTGKVVQKFGMDWQKNFKIDWQRLPRIIASDIHKQLERQSTLSSTAEIDIVRTHVFTAARPNTPVGSLRDMMLNDFTQSHFDVHRFVNKVAMEKCVDIALAVEMLYLATVPDAYDIAVLVTGDKDFIPVLERTRMLGKRVAICATRGNVSQDLIHPQARTRDFDIIWLDDHVDELLVPIGPIESNDPTARPAISSAVTSPRTVEDSGSEGGDDEVLDVSVQGKPQLPARYSKAQRTLSTGADAERLDAILRDSMRKIFKSKHTAQLNSRTLGRDLKTTLLEGGRDALSAVKDEYGSLFGFCTAHSDLLAVEVDRACRDFTVTLLETDGVNPNPIVEVDRVSEMKPESARGRAPVQKASAGNESSAGIGATHTSAAAAMTRATRGGALLKCMLQVFENRKQDSLSSRRVAHELECLALDGSHKSKDSDGASALKVLKARYGSLLRFCIAHSDVFAVRGDDPAKKYEICLLREDERHGEPPTSTEGTLFGEDVQGARAAGPIEVKGSAEEGEEYGRLVSMSAALIEGIDLTSRQSITQEVIPQQGVVSVPADARRTVAELRAVLRGLGLRVSGTKQELLDRLEEHQRSQLYGWSTKGE